MIRLTVPAIIAVLILTLAAVLALFYGAPLWFGWAWIGFLATDGIVRVFRARRRKR